MPDTEKEKPSQIDIIRDTVFRVIDNKKRDLEDDFGDSSDFGIFGIVLVGSFASGKQTEDSDIDYYLLSDNKGYVDDFHEELQSALQKAGMTNVLSRFGVRDDKKNKFKPEEKDSGKGHKSTDFVIISKRDYKVEE